MVFSSNLFGPHFYVTVGPKTQNMTFFWDSEKFQLITSNGSGLKLKGCHCQDLFNEYKVGPGSGLLGPEKNLF